MDNLYFGIFVGFSICLRSTFCLTASFYGDSYLHVPVEDASSETDIRLHFRTYRPDGLLMLAAGDTDFCVMLIEDGMVSVRIDLGSGEASVRSPPGLVFNDLRWHEVQLIRHQARVELHIDGIYTTSVTTPGRFYELNIDHGLYLGSTHATDVFFGHFTPYRGCVEDATFNSVNIFSQSRTMYNFEPLYHSGITWDCSSEFAATSEQPISFLSNTSYIAFPGLNTGLELVRLTFDVRTRTEKGLLLYHSGTTYNSDFVVVEVVNGTLILTINKGNGAMEFLSQEHVADGQWHQIEIIIDPVNVRLAIDGNRKEKRTNFGQNHFLNLDGYLYVGGLDVSTRAKAMLYQLPSLGGSNAAAGSVIGCIQNFKVNGELLGFREAQVTKDLHPECLWSFACTSDPCIEGGTCIEEGYYHYRCICDQAVCFKAGSTGESSSLPISSLLHVQDVVVREGESALITINNIDLLADYQGHGISDVAVLYKALTLPQHGSILFSADKVAQDTDGLSFTQDDLLHNRVTFVHDDTESSSDSIALQLEFLGSNQNVPSKFRETYAFSLMIQVAPWNDKPLLHLPESDILVVVQNTFVILTPDLMFADDTDDDADVLEYSIQYQQGFDIGYFEIADTLGVRARIHSFTQQDINDGKVKFVHRGANIQQFRIQVSDGKDTSDPKMLNVDAVPLRLKKKSNTGLDVFSESVTPLTKTNLTYETNAPNQDIDIRYDVTDPPYYGVLERKLHNGKWKSSTAFTQEDIDENRLRYVHNSSADRPGNDYFRYRVHAMDETTQEFEFFIRVTQVRADLVTNNKLLMIGSKEAGITNDHLRGVSTVLSHNSKDVVFLLIQPPAHGDLIIMDGFNNVKVSEEMSFTQRAVDTAKLSYRLHRTTTEELHDEFQFRLSIPNYVSEEYTFEIKFEPSTTETRFVNNLLQGVKEGGYTRISMDDLYLETPQVRDFRYTVTSFPMHGTLQIISPSSGAILNENTTRFSNSDIRQERLYYQHDDTETMEDLFEFRAVPVTGEAESENTFSDRFEIQIDLENDNAPVRTVSGVIKVVRNGGKLLTTEDIKFIDPDINFDSGNLVYTKDSMENGDLVLSSNHNFSLYNFTQSELDIGHVFFKHLGPRYGRSILRISDGKFITNGSLEVRASDPYITILNNTGLAVQKGQSVPISAMNLSLESNIHATPEDIHFEITIAPIHGAILQFGNGRPRTLFNMKDIKSGRLVYRHDASNFLQDSFHFKANIFETEVEGEVKIRILLDSARDNPPSVISNLTLVVDESNRSIISKEKLRVNHPDTPDSHIIYTITHWPQHGTLSLKAGNQGRQLMTFTQDDINRRKVQYEHSDIGIYSDSFIFDVSNGITALSGLVFQLHILPYMIPLAVHDFTVFEGQRHVLNRHIIQVTEPHFLDQQLQYAVVRAPSSGWLVDSENPKVEVIQFSQQQLNNEQLYYKHDGNDTTHDEFSLMAKSVEPHKQSNPRTIHITVNPDNDQAPKVAVNEELKVWTGSQAVITRDHLRAVDRDSTPAQIVFEVTRPTNGELKLKDYMDSSVTNFTQQQINERKVIFVHKGGREGEFDFKVSDGTNNDRIRTFIITATPLELSLYNDNTLEVFPGCLQPIRREHLYTSTNDVNYSSFIIYSLESEPVHGVLVSNKAGSLFEATSFTQEELNNGTIAYRHFSNIEPPEQYDTFIFEVSAPFAASIEYEQFEITTSYENINADNIDQLLNMIPVTVEEGGQFAITRNNVDADELLRHLYESGLENPVITFVIVELPGHGELKLRGGNITMNTKFTQGDVDGGDMSYKHDDSDTLWDAFYFVIEIQYTHSSGGMTKKTSKMIIPFNITIHPINDRKFELETRHPLITVVQGFVGVINSSHLKTTDPDTGPEDLQYRVADGPTGGYLAFSDDLELAIASFTQADVDSGKLVFVQNGEIYAGGFYFSVSDGRHSPYFKAFNVRVEELTLDISKIHNLELIQGQISGILKPEHFDIKTNGDIHNVMFNVTKRLMHGHLYLNNEEAFQFSYTNIENGEINYVQTVMNRHTDEFEFTLYNKYKTIYRKRMIIKVLPRITVRATTPFKLKPGEAATITSDYLDASELAEFSRSMPFYLITGQPKKGKLVKLVNYRQKRDTMDTHTDTGVFTVPIPIANFTHQDVLDNTIQYKANEDETYEPSKDVFFYTLIANRVQPTPGVFRLTLTPTMKPTTPEVITEKTTNDQSNPSATQSVGEGKTASVRKDTLTIVIVVIALFIGIILLFVIFKCYKRQKLSKQKQRQWAAEAEERRALKGYPDDDRGPLAPPNVYQDPYRRGRNGQHVPPRRYDHQAVPVIITSELDECQRSRSNSMGSYDNQIKFDSQRGNVYPVVTQPSVDRSDYGSGSAPTSPDLDRTLESRSLDSPSDLNRSVPTCKVTPLCDSQDSVQNAGRSPERPGSGGKGSQPRIDWENMDPELLQHYRKTNPVLHKTKHWV